MGSRYFKTKKNPKKYLRKRVESIPLSSQFKRLKSSFSNLIVEEHSKYKFSVIIKIRPDVFSKEYDVKIVYETGKIVSVYIVNEKLEIAQNRDKLPHVFNHDLQKLCLYSKDGGRWSPDKSIVSTIIPWASEWLYYYELWLIDGKWLGGGHDEYADENIIKNE